MTFAIRQDPARAARWRAMGQWRDETLHDLLAARTAATPGKVAITDGARRLTYRELADAVDRVAARLRGLGVGDGDVVAIQLPNWIEFTSRDFDGETASHTIALP